MCMVIPKEHTSEPTSAYSERIHLDVWGSESNPETIVHKNYFISLMDDYSRETTILFEALLR
jgi:hypothetical protein